jgi:hypothetical protein
MLMEKDGQSIGEDEESSDELARRLAEDEENRKVIFSPEQQYEYKMRKEAEEADVRRKKEAAEEKARQAEEKDEEEKREQEQLAREQQEAIAKLGQARHRRRSREPSEPVTQKVDVAESVALSDTGGEMEATDEEKAEAIAKLGRARHQKKRQEAERRAQREQQVQLAQQAQLAKQAQQRQSRSAQGGACDEEEATEEEKAGAIAKLKCARQKRLADRQKKDGQQKVQPADGGEEEEATEEEKAGAIAKLRHARQKKREVQVGQVGQGSTANGGTMNGTANGATTSATTLSREVVDETKRRWWQKFIAPQSRGDSIDLGAHKQDPNGMSAVDLDGLPPGVLHFLGTEGASTNRWRNPASVSRAVSSVPSSGGGMGVSVTMRNCTFSKCSWEQCGGHASGQELAQGSSAGASASTSERVRPHVHEVLERTPSSVQYGRPCFKLLPTHPSLLGGDAFDALAISFDAFQDAVVPVAATQMSAGGGGRRRGGNNRRRSITDGVFSTPRTAGEANQSGADGTDDATAAGVAAGMDGGEVVGSTSWQCSLTVCVGPRFALAPTGYTLRSGSFYDQQMSDWCIEGSEHGDEEGTEGVGTAGDAKQPWCLLRRHTNDGALQAAKNRLTPAAALSSGMSKRAGTESGPMHEAFLIGDTREVQHTWTIDSTGNELAKFRYFRLRSEGPLIVRGFELHGKLFRA